MLAAGHELKHSHRRPDRVSRQPIRRASRVINHALRSDQFLKNTPPTLRNGPLIGFPGRTSLKSRGQFLNMYHKRVLYLSNCCRPR